jgi:DNA-binding CsgD family transcriptional regulator/tetratricopeptide (TPR) repeat protein
MLFSEIQEPSAFVGRDREFNALKSAFSTALSGQGQIVLLTGEPGIGKTRTALELAAYGEAKGARALWGRCYEGQGAPPYWPWIQIMRDYLRSCDVAQLRSELGEAASDVAGVLPEVREAVPDLAPTIISDPEQARFRFFDSVSSFLQRAARNQPLIIILDDLHWADRPSLLLFEFLSQNLGSASILILGIFRDIGLSRLHPLVSTLGGLARLSNLLRVPLGGIDRGAIHSFVRGSLGHPPHEEVVRELSARSQGNPLFLTELVRLLRSGPDALFLVSQVPEGVRDVIRGRLSQLSEECCNILTAASVLGHEFDLVLMDSLIVENSLDEIAAILDEALSVRLIEESPEAVGQYRFTHVLIQETLNTELASMRRASLHRSIAEAIEKVYSSSLTQHAGEIVQHLVQAGPLLDAAMLVKYAVVAGEQALATYAYEDAVDFFQQALAVKQGDLPAVSAGQPLDADAASILFGLGKALGATGQVAEAWARLESAFDFYFAHNDVKRTVDVAEYPLFFVPGLTSVTRMTSQALTKVPPDSLESGRLLARYGMLLNLETGGYQRSQDALEKALGIAQREGDVVLEIQTLTNAADVDWYHTRWEQVIGKCERAIQLARGINRPDLEIWPHYLTATSYWYTTSDRRVSEHVSAALELSEKVRIRGFLAMALTLSASLAQCKGDWDTARESLERSLELSPDFFYPLCRCASLEYELGDYERGEEYLGRLLAVMRKTAPGAVGEYTIVPSTIASTAYISGDHSRFPTAREAADIVLTTPGISPTLASNSYIGLGYIAVLENDKESARQQYDNLKSLNMVFMDDANTSMYRLLGLLARTFGQPQTAASHYEDALSLCRDRGYRPELAWVCYEYARLLTDANAKAAPQGPDSLEKGRYLLNEGLLLAQQLGMEPLLGRLTSIKDRICHDRADGEAASTSAFPDHLTPREVDVLRLIAVGKSNQQIAEDLFISVHTVIYHVRNIFSKTGASNRVEAAAYAARHNLVS